MDKKEDILGEILSSIYDTEKEGNATIAKQVIKTEILFEEDGQDDDNDLDELALLDEIDEFDDIDDAEKLEGFDEINELEDFGDDFDF